MNAVIEIKDVWKTYHIGSIAIHALRGMNFKAFKGEFVSIIGPSGSGKSTAMNMIGSLDIPSKGKIYLDGKDISSLTESDLATIRGKKIGFIFQQFNLINTLTAKENVMLPMIFQNIEREDREEKAERLLHMVDLQDRADHYPNQLSGGQQQRVAIARALANDPEIILADEPTGNLDSGTTNDILQLFDRLNREGRTIIMVTHENDVAAHAKRIIRLHDGLLQSDELIPTVAEVVDNRDTPLESVLNAAVEDVIDSGSERNDK